MKFEPKKVQRSINGAFLKEPAYRKKFNAFKEALGKLLTEIKQTEEANEQEEHFKYLLPPFFKAVGFGDYKINTSSNIDLAIYTGSKTKDPLGVLMEVKRPSNKPQMISKDRLNRKALHEAVLYYLDQRIDQKNDDLKHIIITDLNHWFIFDAHEFHRCFYESPLKRTYKEWKAKRKVSPNNDFMYNQIASFIDENDATISGISLPLKPVGKLLEAKEGSDYEKRLIPLYKLFSPTHLLKEPFANDSNSLNKEFYRELLYILGLEETKEGSTRFIRRAEEKARQGGSLIENTIRILDASDHLSTLKKARNSYGSTRDEQLFSVAMELGITWVNRILFLKLLEAQLYRYHRKDKQFKFLNYTTIDSLDELNKLFFQVLARKEKARSDDVNEKFGHIPYLNSSLFDVSDLEHQTTLISGLDDHAEMPVYSKSVLTDNRGDTLNTLDYLFRFLEAYDFSAEGSEEIRDESKSLINASVLGLIFEKINGYKDGSFYTPGFITEYMARETLKKAIIDAFNIKFDWSCESLYDVEAEIHRDRIPYKDANTVINELKICDPAVGSGHFLVSCLNELIAIKSELRILCDSDMKVLREIDVTVENDELMVSGDDGLFQYEVKHTWQGHNKLKDRNVSPDKERIQKALFHEKRYIIENCLFGVDINPNSVKICRLRLWIELLKRAYYTKESNFMELEVLPNIDINIKEGNSLVSRFELDSDLSSVFKNSEYSLDEYKEAVRNYKETGDRDEKKRLKIYINDVKKNFEVGLQDLHPERKNLKVKEAKLVELTTQFDMFGDEIEGEAGSRKVRIKMAEQELAKQKEKVDALESGAFYSQAFEWRFEFPEVLDDEGRFTGFDVVIGNPPYVRQEQFKELKPYLKDHYSVYQGTADLYSYFIELGMDLLVEDGYFHYIVANKWMRANYGQPLREWLQNEVDIEAIYDFGDLPVFEEATTYPCLLQLNKATPTELFHAVEVETLDFDILAAYLKQHRFESGQSNLQIDGWAMIDEKAQRLLEKLKKKGTPLGEYVRGKIYRGIVTGSNKVFVIDEQTRSQLIEEHKTSAEIIKPFLRGRDIKRYQQPAASEYVIFTRRGIDINNYPAVLNYLKIYKEELEPRPNGVSSNNWKGRKPGSYKWYEIQDAIDYHEEFEKTKIIIPAIVKSANYAFDTEKMYSNDKTTIISKDDKFLLGVLNSRLADFFIFNISSTKRGGYFEYKPMYVDQIPIINPDEPSREKIEKKVKSILSAKKENPSAVTTELEAQIDRLVYEQYGLSEEEIAVVEGST
jgi:hypothetical protein